MMRLIIFSMLALFFACGQTSQQVVGEDGKAVNVAVRVVGDTIPVVKKSEAEWRAELSEQEYYVLREKGTERSFTGDLWNHKGDGLYTCRGCGLPLFESGTKFKSGTGWPSFYEPVKDSHVIEETDNSFGMKRVEVLCASCHGHLGHVFEDGPRPTGLRYCINSVSLDFVEDKEQ